jgi:tryptophanyl-tRNA synthetase
MDTKGTILTGMRPSGRLHLGHYVGALQNWVRLQNEGYSCNFLIVDYHAMADNLDDLQKVKTSVLDMVIDWMAVGLDPAKSNFIVQSYVPEDAELFMLLMPLATMGQLNRNPTLKNEIQQLETRGKSISLAFYSYPMGQAANILLYKADTVPVGEDQEPHVELTREVARKFNRDFADIFPEPRTILSQTPRLVGTDGNAKMSKTLGNTVNLSDSYDEIKKKVWSMYTDPTRIKATDPGHVEGNVVFMYLDAFCTDKALVVDLKKRYEEGRVGDVETKQVLLETLEALIGPIRQRREEIEKDMDSVRAAIEQGSARARQVAKKTVAEVKAAYGISQY